MVKLSHKERIMTMFDGIARHYDLLNHLLSAGIDRRWRRKAAALAAQDMPHAALDAACGTADMCIALSKQGIPQVVGIDISHKMIEIGLKKVHAASLASAVALHVMDGEKMAFANESFDAVTIAFGIRNYENRAAGLSEMLRILRPQGRLVILEFSMPRNAIVRQCYELYFRRILPCIGRMISRHHSAYHYLPQSVQDFPSPHTLCSEIMTAGFASVAAKPLSMGIVHLYNAKKR
jgi:demethylmenaquinone methyltransferase/2-methoxy-6-polyprenyl-1,4-benzoquinol methylase